MPLCVPSIVGPISELNTSLHVQGQVKGATVIIRSVGSNPRDVAKAVVSSPDTFINLLPTVTLDKSDLLVAMQELGAETSQPTPKELAMGVQPKPTSASQIGFVGFQTHLYECGEAVWISGAVPGAKVELVSGSPAIVLGSGAAFDGNARFTLSPQLTSSKVSAHQVIPGLPNGPDTDRVPDPLPVAQQDPLPPPTILPPVKACQGTVAIADVFDGARVTLKRTAFPAETALFDLSSISLRLNNPLKDGEKLVVSQSFQKCRRTGTDSSPETHVAPAVPIEVPRIDAKLCAGATRVPVNGLIPGAKVKIIVDSIEFDAQAPLDSPSHEFDLGVPLPAGKPVTVKQERCGIFGDPFTPPVTVDAHENVTTPPEIVGPLVGCGRFVFVRNVHARATLQVFSRLRGDTPISDQVSFDTTSGGILVYPYLTAGDDITVAQWACGGARVDSVPATHVDMPSPLVGPTLKPLGAAKEIVSGDTAVEVLGCQPGAEVDVYVTVLERRTRIGTGIANPPGIPTIVYHRSLVTGEKIQAQQFLCNDQSPLGPIVTVVIPRPLPPVLVSPAANATKVPKRPTLQWSDPGAGAERKATSYLLEVRQGATTVVPPTTINTTGFLVNTDLAFSTKFTWFVTGVNSTGPGESSHADFTTEAAPPPPGSGGGPGASKPVISVSKSAAGAFNVTGSGFLASHAVHIRVVRQSTLQSDYFQANSDASGKVATTITFPAVAGEVYDFSANDGRPDHTDLTGTLWSNTAPITA